MVIVANPATHAYLLVRLRGAREGPHLGSDPFDGRLHPLTSSGRPMSSGSLVSTASPGEHTAHVTIDHIRGP